MHKLTRCYKNIAHLLIKAWFYINCNEFRLFTTMRKQESLKTPAKCNLA